MLNELDQRYQENLKTGAISRSTSPLWEEKIDLRRRTSKAFSDPSTREMSAWVWVRFVTGDESGLPSRGPGLPPVGLAPGSDLPHNLDRIKISNPDKVIFADPEITKGDVIRYYAKVEERMLRLFAQFRQNIGNAVPEYLVRRKDGHILCR